MPVLHCSIICTHTVDSSPAPLYNSDMFEIKDLQQLIKIADCGTISRAAEELYISQPALSRSMQKLESELGVQLFTRAKNRVELNDIGTFFVQTAREIVAACEEGISRLRTFDRERNTFAIGACAPAPMWKLVSDLSPLLGDRRVSTEIKDTEELLRGLGCDAYKLIITNSPVAVEGVICRKYFTERLLLCLPAEHRLAAKKKVTFDDIDGITMLLYDGIGVWRGVRDKIPHTRFIVQNEFDDFSDLVRQSSLPSFATDVMYSPQTHGGRVVVPVEDEGAAQTFYICAKDDYKNFVRRALAAEGEN